MSSIKFSTKVTIPESNFKISHEDSILLIGSCFAQNIGQKLTEYKFNATINPNGIIYNPISIVEALKHVISGDAYTQQDLYQHKNKWVSFSHHGDFSNRNVNACLEDMNDSVQDAHRQLKEAKTIFITLGTAWVYEFEGFGVVANCHKIPGKQFKKRLLSVKEILAAFSPIIEQLKDVQMVFTVSPVRHYKDGLHQNNLSKSTLHLAINHLVEQYENCHYFAAYELVIDELRDYRYYKDDLVHPTDFAIDYIWNKFCTCFMQNHTLTLNEEISKVIAASKHKPFDFESEEHQEFITQQLSNIKVLQDQNPFLDLSKEILDLKVNS
jgi:hypothetical protein